ncbi:MAG: family 43 glycosylhydrolase, partial [Flavisolibacter sp.]
MMQIKNWMTVALITMSFMANAQHAPLTTSGNPVFPGWYADPEVVRFDHTLWIYPTYSAPYEQQVFMDAFSSNDGVHWQKHEKIVDTAAVKWAKKAMWAPAMIKKDGL